jgi:hypothetical protein
LGVTLAALCAAPAAHGAQALATTFTGALIRFDTDAPGTILSSTPITGLAPDTIGSVRDIDLRPATGGLYGIAVADTDPSPLLGGLPLLLHRHDDRDGHSDRRQHGGRQLRNRV